MTNTNKCKVCNHSKRKHQIITSPSGIKKRVCFEEVADFKGFGSICCGCNLKKIPDIGGLIK